MNTNDNKQHLNSIRAITKIYKWKQEAKTKILKLKIEAGF